MRGRKDGRRGRWTTIHEVLTPVATRLKVATAAHFPGRDDVSKQPTHFDICTLISLVYIQTCHHTTRDTHIYIYIKYRKLSRQTTTTLRIAPRFLHSAWPQPETPFPLSACPSRRSCSRTADYHLRKLRNRHNVVTCNIQDALGVQWPRYWSERTRRRTWTTASLSRPPYLHTEHCQITWYVKEKFCFER